MFLEQGQFIVVGISALREAASSTFTVTGWGPRAEVGTVIPRPLAIRIGGGTTKVLSTAVAGERLVTVGVVERKPAAPVGGQEITAFDICIRIVDTDRGPVRRLLHACSIVTVGFESSHL